jgi:long-chain acyl-CoA synthetase
MITVDTSPWARKPAGFGQTEVMGMLTLNAWGGESAGNSGRPTPMVQVRIVDPDGHEVEPGETGEITARGPTVMNGYHNRPELNATPRRRVAPHQNPAAGARRLDQLVGSKPDHQSAAEAYPPRSRPACRATLRCRRRR